jgi:hypothetical protein
MHLQLMNSELVMLEQGLPCDTSRFLCHFQFQQSQSDPARKFGFYLHWRLRFADFQLSCNCKNTLLVLSSPA